MVLLDADAAEDDLWGRVSILSSDQKFVTMVIESIKDFTVQLRILV